MKLTDFIYRTVASHNTSLGDNLAFPPREDMAFDYLVVKERFDEVIRNVESEFGYIPTPDEAATLLSELITLAQRKEEPLRDQLETLAYNIVNEVLCVPKETVILRTSLVNRVEPLNNIRLMPEDDDEGNEGYTFDDVDEIIFTNKLVMKRRLINSLTQGVSYRLMLKYLDDDQIYEWDDELVGIYFKIVYLNDYLLFTKKEKISDKNPMLGSYVDTDLGEGEFKTEIDAQALVYPLLLQETFRGFFEVCGSYCLPDDKKKTNMILHKADFLVAEAWDLRLGVGLWDKIEACYDINVTSHIPYVFTSLAGLQGDEFNDMMQNVFCHTKKAQEYIKGIIDDVEYDQAYQTFKQDIQTSDLKKCLINDDTEEENTITESGMRAWKYWDKLQEIAKEIFENKYSIISNGGWVCYDIDLEDGRQATVFVANPDLYKENFPEQANARGFANENEIVMWVDHNTPYNQIVGTLTHELEHVIDRKDYDISDSRQIELMQRTYGNANTDEMRDTPDKDQLFGMVRDIVYHLWINTESNAFISNALRQGDSFFERLEFEIKEVDQSNPDEFAELWDYFGDVMARKNKRSSEYDERNPQLVKKHFVAQSFHKLKKLKRTYHKKLAYAKMNGIDMSADYTGSKYYVMDPTKGTTESQGPYTLEDIKSAVSQGYLSPNAQYVKAGTKDWRDVVTDELLYDDEDWDILNGITREH